MSSNVNFNTKMYQNTDILKKSLDATWKRNEVLSNNIANVDTPNYKRKDVVFESLLSDALKKEGGTSSIAFNKLEPQVVTDSSSLSYRLDGNNVDIDAEMSKFAENQLRYNTLVSQVDYNFQRLKMVMTK